MKERKKIMQEIYSIKKEGEHNFEEDGNKI